MPIQVTGQVPANFTSGMQTSVSNMCAVYDGTDTIYIGGNFTNVGYNLQTSQYDLTANNILKLFPKVDGQIVRILLDSTNNSTYYFGSFSTVGGVSRAGAFQLDRNGNLTSWDPNIQATVLDACWGYNASANDSIIVSVQGAQGSGAFTVNGVACNGFAKIDKTSASVLFTGFTSSTFTAGSSLSAASDGSYFFLVGDFTVVNGTTRNFALRWNNVTNTLDGTFNPNLNVFAWKVLFDTAGSRVFIGGQSTMTVGGTSRPGIAQVSPTSGAIVTGFNTSSSCEITDIKLAGLYLYLVASGGGIGGNANYKQFGRVLASTGVLDTAWCTNTSITSGSGVISMAISSDGARVYIFTTNITGAPAANAGNATCLLTASNNTVDSNFVFLSSSSQLNVFIIGTTLYTSSGVSGMIHGGFYRQGACAISVSSGQVLSWAPTFLNGASNAFPTTLIFVSNVIYAFGIFTTVNGSSRAQMAALDTTGALTSWRSTGTIAGGNILHAVYRTSSGSIYCVGSFTTIDGNARNKVCEVLVSTGVLQTFNIGATTNITQFVMCQQDNTYLYVCHNTSNGTIGGTTRAYVAAVALNNGSLNNWNPAPNGSIVGMYYDSTSNWIYLSGTFTTVAATARSGLAALAAANNTTLQTWNPTKLGTGNGMITGTAAGSLIYLVNNSGISGYDKTTATTWTFQVSSGNYNIDTNLFDIRWNRAVVLTGTFCYNFYYNPKPQSLPYLSFGQKINRTTGAVIAAT